MDNVIDNMESKKSIDGSINVLLENNVSINSIIMSIKKIHPELSEDYLRERCVTLAITNKND
ncbi:hypothetical protein SAMN05216390_13717 [Lachnospiraceae bacterium KH1T2]|nr:hypothetical protein SAMN05216390_13717 [Lachnospiraceae bacterium KH1T2]